LASTTSGLPSKAAPRDDPRQNAGVFLYLRVYSINGMSMALSLKDPETDALARAVAALTGESLTEAVRTALAERLARERLRRGETTQLADQLDQLGRECAALPDLDPRSPDEIVGYDDTGLWR
jgi:antitoxin VapB